MADPGHLRWAGASAVRRAFAVGLLAAAMTPLGHGAGISPAMGVVEGLHQALARQLDATGAKDRAVRAEALAPVVARSFDFEAISRTALGTTYDALDSAARERFRELMRRLSTLTYADRFGPSEGELRFVTIEERPARRGRVLVRTRLERKDDDPVQLDYVLQETPAGPLIVNVLAEGVSDLSLKRAEYSAVIRDEGVDALFERIAGQVRTLMGSSGPGS